MQGHTPPARPQDSVSALTDGRSLPSPKRTSGAPGVMAGQAKVLRSYCLSSPSNQPGASDFSGSTFT
jgi:hypothetical protein